MANADAFKSGFNKGAGKKDPEPSALKKLPHFNKGGKVKKTGVAHVEKGEYVLTKKKAKKYAKEHKKVACKG